MTQIEEMPTQGEFFQISRFGDVAVVEASPEIENMASNLIEAAAAIVLNPLRDNPPNALIIDLSRVSYFGSEFISFLLRCHLIVKKSGADMVLAGVSPRIKELVRQTALDTIWAIYDTREEALKALRDSI